MTLLHLLSAVRPLALTAALGALLTIAAPAQITVVPGTGCPNAAAPSTFGSPRPGNNVTVTCPCAPGEVSLILVGLCMPGGSMPMPGRVGCASNCGLGVNIFPLPITLVLPNGSQTLPIPPSFMPGMEFCVQCGCANMMRSCVVLSKALRMKVF